MKLLKYSLSYGNPQMAKANHKPLVPGFCAGVAFERARHSAQETIWFARKEPSSQPLSLGGFPNKPVPVSVLVPVSV